MKNLFASPVGRDGKDLLRNIIRRFGCDAFDYLIFSYDGSPFDEPEFACCDVITEAGFHPYFFKTYLTPDRCAEYGHVFPWMDDIDIGTFDVQNFLAIMVANDLEVAQPALTPESRIAHPVTARQDWASVGRFTDFIETMAQVFRRDAWEKYWHLLDDGDYTSNPYGWGYDVVARKACGFSRMGIIDCEPVTHTRVFTDVVQDPGRVETIKSLGVAAFDRLMEQYGFEEHLTGKPFEEYAVRRVDRRCGQLSPSSATE